MPPEPPGRIRHRDSPAPPASSALPRFRGSRCPCLRAVLILTLLVVPHGLTHAEEEDLESLLGLEEAPEDSPDEPRRAVENEEPRSEPPPAEGPDSSRPEEPAPEVAATRRSDRYIEEIVVTAQHRSENVRDVPMALSVVSGEDLRESALSGFDDVARYIPNVSFNSDFNSLYFRGIGTAELNPLGEVAVVYLLDEVYVPRTDYLKPGLLDVGQIQFLKGPQGTLYGRNATGGVIKVDYAEPTHEWTGFVDLTVGERDRGTFEGALSGPLAGWLTARVAGRLHREDGHTLNQLTGRVLGDKDIHQWRAKLRAEPLSWIDATFSVERFDYLIGIWAGSELHEYPQDFRAAIEVLDPAHEAALNRRGSLNDRVPNRSEGNGWIAPLEVAVDAWNHMWTSISAFGKLRDFQGGDVDITGARLVELLTDLDSDRWSQELRVTSPPGALEYVGGFFSYWSNFDGDLDVPTIPDPGVGTLSESELGAFATLIEPLLEPGTDPVAALLGIDEQLDNLQAVTSVDIGSLGLYGQIRWSFLDQFSLILGGRFSRDQREGHYRLFSQGPIWFAATEGGHDTHRRFTDTNFSPKVSLLWEAIDEITAYATYAQGYRSGSFNVAALTPEQFSFGGETSDTYEAGVKTEWFGGAARVNLGGFFTRYEDYQIVAFNGLGYIINNAEKAETKGIESDATAVLPAGLFLNGSFGFNEARFLKFTGGTCTTQPPSSGNPPQVGTFNMQECDLSGRPLHRAPRWTGSLGLSWEGPEVPWPVRIRPLAGVDATYKGAEFMDSDLDPLDHQSGYWLFNGRAGVRTVDDRWSLTVHGKNLADELVKVASGDPVGQPGAHWALTNPPRTIFASLRFSY